MLAIRLLPLLAIAALGAACSSSDDTAQRDAAGSSTTGSTAAVAAPERPDGPTAQVEGPLTGGNGVFMGAVGAVDLDAAGYVQEEYAASGTAVSYTAEELPADGTSALVEGPSADYRTRFVVRRPADQADFNGTVVLEWLNVSGGLDADPGWSYLADELVRTGTAWVGVSAQRIGIEGGPVLVSVGAGNGIAGVGLKALDPERYGDLAHPGDQFAYDLFTQVARAVRAGEGAALGDLEPARLLAAGESQSAFTLTTYANGVQPLAGQFDGFFIHSRGSSGAPLTASATGAIDIAGSIGGEPTIIREDLDVPVLILQTETDMVGFFGYASARQADSDRLRVWEIAGAAHADRFLLEPIEESLGCPTAINDGPLHFVAKAAFRHLVAWAAGGPPPPSAMPIDIEDSSVVRDADGIATGGIRTPLVDVPVATLSGEAGPGASIACSLFGSTIPFTAERLGELYPTIDEYLEAFETSTDDAIAAGFVLEDDRDALLDEAQPDLLAG